MKSAGELILLCHSGAGEAGTRNPVRVCKFNAVVDSGFGAEPVIGPAEGRTRWRRPGMTQ
jgi:hypothetical protein